MASSAVSPSASPTTSIFSTSPSVGHKSLLQRAKRKLSAPGALLPKFLRPENDSVPEMRAVTLMPTTHRENTALHVLMDTLPSLPSLGAPSFSFSFPSLTFPSRAVACFTPESALEDEPPSPTTVSSSQDPLKKLEGNVVCLGGYRGSILREATTGKRLWIPLRVGLGIRKPDLSLGLDDEDEERATETVVPGKMLMAIGGVLDLGKRLKDKLKALESESSDLSFHSFGYDWRLGLERSSAELLVYLERLKQESAERGEGPDGTGRGATVIAHSMGGLVALHALAKAKDPTVFRRLVCAGTPFGGCVNALGPLKLGDGVLLNREICSPRVVFSMRSTFYFLPESGACFEKPDGTPLPVDFFDPATWSTHALSPMTAGLFTSPPGTDERQELKAEAEQAHVLPPPHAKDVDSLVAAATVLSDSDGSDREAEMEDAAAEAEAKGTPVAPPSSGSKTPPSEAAIAAYLSKTLARVRKFHHEILDLYDPAKAAAGLYPPIALLVSSRTPTVRGVLVQSGVIAAQSYEHLLYGPGDGIVLHESSCALPGQWGSLLRGTVESNHGHVSLLGDLDGVRKCLALLA